MAVSNPAPAVSTGAAAPRQRRGEVKRAEVLDHQEKRDQESEVANAVVMNAFLPAAAASLLQ
jgi:hypothetical protein